MTAPVVFVFAHCLRRSWPRSPWEVALVRVEPGDEPGGWVEAGRDVFRVEVASTKHADPDLLGSSGFYTRHPRGRSVAGALPGCSTAGSRPYGGDGPARLPFDEHYVSSYAGALRVARFTHGLTVGALDAVDTVAPLAAFLRFCDLEPTWSAVIDVQSWRQGAQNAPAPWTSFPFVPPMVGVDGPPAAGADALAHARWAARLWGATVARAAREADSTEDPRELSAAPLGVVGQ